MILDRSRLVNVLDILKVSCGNKVMEVSYYVKIVVDKANHALYLSTTDFHSFIVVDFGDVSLTSLDDVPDEFLLNFKHLHDLVKCSTTANVSMRSSGPDRITVTTNGQYDFPTYGDAAQFPVSDFSHEVAGSWDSSDLQSIWTKVSTVVSKDVTKVSYQGVNYDGNWAASDNRRFAIISKPDGHEYVGKGILIPIVFGDILAMCAGQVTIGLNTAGNMLVLSCPDSGILAAMRLLDASFVQYQRILDSRSPYIRMVMPKQYLLGALQRMACFTDKLFKVGTFTIIRDEAGASIRCQIQLDSNAGDESVEAMDFDFDSSLDSIGKIASFQYQIENLAAGIAAVDSNDEVSISFQSDGKLWIDEGNFSYLLSRITS